MFGTSNVFRFKESRSRLLIRKRIAEKTKSGIAEFNQDLGDDSTAPTTRTKTAADESSTLMRSRKPQGRLAGGNAALDDSLEGAGLEDLQKTSSPLKLTLTARGERNGIVVRRADTDHNELSEDGEEHKTIYNSCPENVRKTEARMFLEKLGMSRFVETLFRNGFDEMDKLLEIGDETLKQLSEWSFGAK